MAIGRYLAHRKTADGSYEDVYLKSESGLIYRPNGRTVEQDLAAYLPEYQNSDTVPESLTPGKLVVYNDRVYIGDVSGNVMEVVLMNHELNIGTIGGKTTDQLADYLIEQMVENRIGITGSGGTSAVGVFDIYPALGALITIGSYQYRIVHVSENGVVYAILAYWVKNVQFDSDISNNVYANSDIKTECDNWFANEVPTEMKELGIFADTVVESVASPCFIPSYAMCNPAENNGENTFDFFKEQGGRVFRNSSGGLQTWWTASKYSSGSYVWYVTAGGSFNYYNPTGSRGFRPCLSIVRSAFTIV